MAGRAALLTTVINSLPNLHFQSFLVPAIILDEFYKVRRSFLSNHLPGPKKMHHFSWELAEREKKFGGTWAKKYEVYEFSLVI